MTVLVCHSVTKTYSSQLGIFDVSLDVSAGEVCALVGSNGAGKTTLINIIAGIIRADSGTIIVDGLDAEAHSLPARRLIAYVPETAALYGSLTVRENLLFFSDLSEEPDADDGTDILSKLSFPMSRLDSHVMTLSKGLRQKVAIAIGLARRVKIFVFDEPTSGLDPGGIMDFSLILREVAALGKAVMIASHDLEHVCSVASRIGLLRAGRLVLMEDAGAISLSELRRLL